MRSLNTKIRHCEPCGAGRSNLIERSMGLLRRPFRAPRKDVFIIAMAFCIVLYTALSSCAAEPALPFAKGEVITYAIKKLAIKAGEATLTFEGSTEVKGQPVYLIIFKADGFNFYDEEKIYVDQQTFAPVMVARDLNIFGSKEKITEEYLSKEGKIVISKTAGDKTTQQVIEKQGQIDNIYGAIYRYRAFGKFTPNDQVQLRLPTQDVTLKLEKTVALKAAGKRYQAFYMSSVPSKYQVWFDVGQQKIPLEITGAVGMANTTMIMRDYKSGQ
jgi:hypothetical protein